MNRWLLLAVTVLVPSMVHAELLTETVEYKQNGTALEGYLAYKKDATGKRPAVLVVHDWKGIGDHYRSIADKLAEMGYVAFAVDIFGKGVRPSTSEQAASEAKKYKEDRPLMRERVKAGLAKLASYDFVDPKRIAAIGYCFGGTVALELARSGADLKGVVSFHGGLDTPTPGDAKQIKAKVLALHGADDPFVTPTEVAAFQEEMRKGKVDWQFVAYGNNVHAFTAPAAGTDKSKGAAYDETADKRSWKAMKVFFKEILDQ